MGDINMDSKTQNTSHDLVTLDHQHERSSQSLLSKKTLQTQNIPRNLTRKVNVGGVGIGQGSPVSVQTMLSIPTTDVDRCLDEINRMASLGCEIIRLALPDKKSICAFEEICKSSVLPVVADIHFDYKLAIEAAKRGAAKLRINPGNIGGIQKVDAVIDAAGEANIPIRIGVNAGSLDSTIADMQGVSLSEKLAISAQEYVEHFESRGFKDIVVSAKAHDVLTTIDAYRIISKSLPTVPLHIGITEAGTLRQGTVKSAVGLGILLAEGIGDTLRVSLTADISEEVLVGWEILSALGIRRRTPELISCPTCGRTKVDLISMAKEVSKRLENISLPIKVAVMGCVVNGPGEAADADIGMAAGAGFGTIFKHGEVIRRVDEKDIVDVLFEEIEKL